MLDRMTTDVALRMEDLTKFYGGQRGIDGLDLEVAAGEVMGFLGPNGAGKTTTISCCWTSCGRPADGR
jgi:ABC-2 type transport system ATP-binding protein